MALIRCQMCGVDCHPNDFSPSMRRGSFQRCRRCVKYQRHGSAWKHGVVTSPFPLTFVFNCRECGERSFSGKARAWFCGSECKERYKNVRLRAERLERKLAAAARFCPHCGEELDPAKRADACFCSERCEQAAHNATRKAKWKVGYPVEYVSRAQIIARDGPVCHICGGDVEPDDVHLDHVVPLARGGTHAADNLAVAHSRCNLSKRHTLSSAA